MIIDHDSDYPMHVPAAFINHEQKIVDVYLPSLSSIPCQLIAMIILNFSFIYAELVFFLEFSPLNHPLKL